MLLHMLSFNFLNKVAKGLDFYSTTVLLLDFFDKDQTSLNISQLNKVAKGLDFSVEFLLSKSRVKNRGVWPGPI